MRSIFLEPKNSTHRQYEAMRAYIVEGQSAAEAARRFGYSPGTLRVMCHELRKFPARRFFLDPVKGPAAAPKRDRVREQVVAMRKRNFSIYDISRALADLGRPLSVTSVAVILKEEGFARLPRRGDEERRAGLRPEKAAVADARTLDLTPRSIRTKFGGLFLFFPFLVQTGLDRMLDSADFPGTQKIPAGCAMRSLLALKLWGVGRPSNMMSHVFDEGLGLFAGLNVIPKRSFLTEYSCRIRPESYPALMGRWFEAMNQMGIDRGQSFDVDFHTIPYHGDKALMEKHYVSRRSRRQNGILAFLAQDATTRVFCYANGTVRKENQNDEILAFVEYWKQRTGKYPEELVFDSRLTTYANLNQLNRLGIKFITLRRRTPKMLRGIEMEPLSAWRRVALENVTRTYRHPKVLDRQITLTDYDEPIREIVVKDLGHSEPTIVLTNYLPMPPAKIIGRYAQRMIIENGIEDSVDFYHMDALSSAVAMKVDCDLQLTLMASSLYRLLAQRIGNGFARAKGRQLFRNFVDATATVVVSERDIAVHFQKRAYNPLLLAAKFDNLDLRIPWLQNRRFSLVFG